MKSGEAYKVGVLVIGPVAPPLGGMTISIDNIVTSKLKDKYDFYILDITGYRTRKKRAGFLRGAFYQFYLILKLCHIFITKKPHIAHVHVASFLYFYRRCVDIIICKLFGAKVIFHLHGAGFIEFYGKSSAIGRWAIRSMVRICDRAIVLSTYWYDFLSTITDQNKISMAPNGVKFSDFRLDKDKRGELGFSKDQVVVLFMGPIGKRKGSFDLLKAIPIVMDKAGNVTFVFCGSGEFDGEIEQFIDSMSTKDLIASIKYVGNVAGQEKIDYYKSSDIFVLPSHKENLPNAILEAMAAGLPVVVSDVGGIPELIKNGVNGFLIKAGDINGIAEKIVTLAQDCALRKSMGQTNIRLVREKYDMPIIADKIDSIYHEL